MKIVEFIGPTGSGKTTLQCAAREFLRSRGVGCRNFAHHASWRYAGKTWGRCLRPLLPEPIWRRFTYRLFGLEALLRVGTFARHHPDLWRLVVDSQKGRDLPPSEKRMIWRAFRRVAVGSDLVRAVPRPGYTVLFSEGLAQRALMLFVSTADRAPNATICRYLDLLPRPDLLVWVRCGLATSLERSVQRKLPRRFRDRSPQIVQRIVSKQYEVIENAGAHLRSMGWPVLEVVNENMDEAKRSLDRGLADWLNGAVR